MKTRKLGLLPRLILAIIAGIIIGLIVPPNFSWIVQTLITFSSIFAKFLDFAIPLIIVAFVAPGIGDLGEGAGKMLAITAGIAYASTIIAGLLAYFANTTLLPRVMDMEALSSFTEVTGRELKPFFEIEIPPVFGVMTALILAFVLGIGMAAIRSKALSAVMHEFAEVIEKLISSFIVPLLPLHIAGIFANMAYTGKVATVLSVFIKVFILVVILHIIILVFQYFVAGSMVGKNPLKLLKNMLPAYMTAVGTQSSAATIPVTLAATKKNGVVDAIAEFVIPLCATIHLSGSTITLTSCSIAMLMINGKDYNLGIFFPFILALGVTMVAAPGVPGGAVMAAVGLLSSMLGFTESMVALMIALYMAQDSFGTACNVTGDGAIALIMNKISGHKLEKPTPEEEHSILAN